MTFRRQTLTFGNVRIHLMYFDSFNPLDYLDRLTSAEQERFFSFSHISRKQEFTATRILRHELFGFSHIQYDQNGAPFIEHEGYISISHATGVVGIAVCEDYKIGLDLEPVQDKALRLKNKFLNPQEQLLFNLTDPIELTKTWSVKEVLYKLAGRKKIIFREDLILSSRIDSNHFQASIYNPNQRIDVVITSITQEKLAISFNEHAPIYYETSCL